MNSDLQKHGNWTMTSHVVLTYASNHWVTAAVIPCFEMSWGLQLHFVYFRVGGVEKESWPRDPEHITAKLLQNQMGSTACNYPTEINRTWKCWIKKDDDKCVLESSVNMRNIVSGHLNLHTFFITSSPLVPHNPWSFSFLLFLRCAWRCSGPISGLSNSHLWIISLKL